MPAYTFHALDSQGKTRKGVLEADSARAARAALRSQTLVPLEVEPVEQGGQSSPLTRPIFGARVMRGSNLSVWTRQIAELISAGLTVDRALTALIDGALSENARSLIASLRAEVNAGAPLARAMAMFPREFSDVYTAVIAAGEQGGFLGEVLTRLADDLEELQTLRSRLINAALYPAIVTFVAIGIVVFLLSYVVPQVTTVFIGTHHTLPLLTRVMLSISATLRAWGLWGLGALALMFVLWRWALTRQELRLRWDGAWLRLPVLGAQARGYNAARFASTLAMLTSAGVPILRSMQAATQTLSNTAMRRDAGDALVLVREGAPLAAALAQKKCFPSLLPMFARLGEQTGNLPLMLERVARQLSSQVQRRAIALATILEPLLIVIMGAVVMLIVLSVMQPIIELNGLVK